MRLSKAAVYNPHKSDMTMDEVDAPVFEVPCPKISSDIVIKDHYFDKSERRRRKQRKAKPDDIQLDGAMTGERGVRDNYKINKSKILPM